MADLRSLKDAQLVCQELFEVWPNYRKFGSAGYNESAVAITCHSRTFNEKAPHTHCILSCRGCSFPWLPGRKASQPDGQGHARCEPKLFAATESKQLVLPCRTFLNLESLMSLVKFANQFYELVLRCDVFWISLDQGKRFPPCDTQIYTWCMNLWISPEVKVPSSPVTNPMKNQIMKMEKVSAL